ncbi:MAG: MaoC/PaaZ C-terminal domain-containing protein [Halobacteriales archaeon]
MPAASVGDSATGTLAATTEAIEAFAALTGDDNPLHVDDDYAADGPFGGRVAHGMLTAGAISAALADLPGDVVYVSQDLSFLAPVEPGETVIAEVEVVEHVEGDRLRVATTASAGGEQVIDGEAVVLSVPHGTGDD